MIHCFSFNFNILVDVDESADKFYAVARGKVNGIFTSYEEVKKHVILLIYCLYVKWKMELRFYKYIKAFLNAIISKFFLVFMKYFL